MQGLKENDGRPLHDQKELKANNHMFLASDLYAMEGRHLPAPMGPLASVHISSIYHCRKGVKQGHGNRWVLSTPLWPQKEWFPDLYPC